MRNQRNIKHSGRGYFFAELVEKHNEESPRPIDFVVSGVCVMRPANKKVVVLSKSEFLQSIMLRHHAAAFEVQEVEDYAAVEMTEQ